jgi:hypothetical protein
VKLRISLGLAAGAAGLGLLAPAAHAAVPVNLRIEGPKRTVFEGRVNVPVRTFSFTGEKARHTCDGTGAIGGPSAKPVATRGGAIAEASERFGFAIKGTWGDFGATFTRVGGQDVAFDAKTNSFLAEYENGAFAQLGACADQVHRGDDVLFAYGDGSEPLLALSGHTRVKPGRAVTVHVADAKGAAVAGARVRGVTTGADGSATLGALSRGYHDLKATKPGTIRSERLRVCVTDGHDRACPPRVTITDIAGGHRFRRSVAPKRLRGVVETAPFGVRAVRLTLTRRAGGHTTTYTGRRFARGHRDVGVKAGRDWRLSLRSRLPRGRYVLRAVATDRRGVRARDEVSFRVS